MRRFMDLHINPLNERIKEMLEKASELGYKGLGISTDLDLVESVRGEASVLGLDVVSRVNLKPHDTNDLTRSLRRTRRRFEILSVECSSRAIARQAAKDHRVDILRFPGELQQRLKVRFDRQEANLAADLSCAYEVSLSDLLGKGPRVLSRLLSVMREEVQNSVKFDVPIVVSSGADTSLLMREPRAMASVLSLLGLDEEQSLNAVSSHPWHIVSANRGKLGPGFISPGLRVV
jgi:ribonuclease P/MRP protein subunit RPP1